jgi:hypothetical protein
MRVLRLCSISALLAGPVAAEDDTLVLDNDHAAVHRNAAPCAGGGPGCGERIVVAFGDVKVVAGGSTLQLGYAEVFVAEAGTSYEVEGDFAEVNLKPDPPAVDGPAVAIPAGKNERLHDAEDYFVFEERLEPGDTRERHSHAQRVVLVMGATELQQWPDGADEVFKTQIPGTIKFNPPVVHIVKNIGDAPLRNIVIELIPR